MDPKLNNKDEEIIEIEDDFIDLDETEETPEELIYEWDVRIRKTLSALTLADNEKVLGDLMKEYLKSLREVTNNFDDNEALKTKVFRHISFFYSYYVELQCCTADNYLCVMEDILTLYCNLEIEVVQSVKKKEISKKEYKSRILSVCKRIIHVLTVYLLDSNEHILHVLIKSNSNNSSEPCIEVLRVLYKHFLTKVPVRNLSDESFCRNYILFQKWKQIRPVDDWPDIDRVMYKRCKRTPESIENNETLKKILTRKCHTAVDVVCNLFLTIRDMSNAYFKHMESKHLDFEDLDLNIDLGEDDPIIPVEEENDEDVECMKVFYEVERNMSTLEKAPSNRIICKQEFDEDDDVQFVGVGFLQMPIPQKEKILDVENEDNKNQDEDNPSENEAFAVPAAATSVPSSQQQDEIESCSTQTTTEVELNETPLISKKTVEVEVQVDANDSLVYSEYGITTPPFESDNSKLTTESCVYANISAKNTMKSVEVQVEPTNGLYDLGLTPPSDTPSEDHNSRPPETCFYTSINQNHVDFVEDQIKVATNLHEDDIDTSEMSNVDEEIDIVEDLQSLPTTLKDAYESFGSNNQIDTGQDFITDTSPNIENNSIAEIPQTKDYVLPTFNGNSVLQPLLTSNRTNGAKDSPTKIVFTSSQKIKASLADFSRFENEVQNQWSKLKENHDLDKFLSGPITKMTPTKHVDIFDEKQNTTGRCSRSSSPTEMTSPAYEEIDDFRNFYSDSINGCVTAAPAHPGILKKNSQTKKKNFRIMFSDFPEENRFRNETDAVLVPKRIRRDKKLNMEAKVVLERMSFIESKMKQVSNNPPTLRVDYDKSTRYINNKDVVRCISPPRYTWIIKSTPKTVVTNPSRSRHLTDEKILDLKIPDPEILNPEFSSSPKFLQDPESLVKSLESVVGDEEAKKGVNDEKPVFLSDNSNFYKNSNNNCIKSSISVDVDNSKSVSLNDSNQVQLPTAVPESYDFDRTLKNEVFSKIDLEKEDSEDEIKLPLKKRKLSVPEKKTEDSEEPKKEEISYPATPMISIAEVEALHLRKFKTAAERKEMPPLSVLYSVESDPSPIITDQFNINNHTYNNPTINYHMNNVPFVPCGSYYLPPILVPFNNVSNFDQNKLNLQQQKKEKKPRQRRRL